MNAMQLAGALPRDTRFRAYMAEMLGEPVDEAQAAQLIRDICGVRSRRELSIDARAEEAFEMHVRRPYARWREQAERRQA
jgi:hypothetical protein